MKYVLEVMEKQYEKDAKGNVKNQTFVPIGKIRTSWVFPADAEFVKTRYGSQEKITHQLVSYDPVSVKQYIRFNNQVFQIKLVETYPRLYLVLLELVA